MERIINIQKSIVVYALIVLITLGFNSKTFANGGIYGSFIVTNNGTSDSWKASSDFKSFDFGTLTSSSTLILKGGQIKTWKGDATDITGGKTWYTIYLKGSFRGSFRSIALGWNANNADGTSTNQIWQDVSQTIDVKSGLTAGKYYFEVYHEATANDGSKYDNNSTNNYIATFSIANENPPTAFTATKLNHQQIDLAWTQNATYTTTIVVARKGAAPNDLTSGTAYSVGDGDINTAAGKIVYKGTGSSFSHTGLDASTSYYYKVVSVNNDYYSSAVSANATTDAPPATSITATADSTLKESNLNANRIALTISEGTFVDATLDKSNFSLINAPEGLTIESVEYISSTEAKVNLAFDGTDFDADINDLKVQVLAAELSCGTDLSSATLSISALNDAETLSLAWDSSIGTNGAELTIGNDAIIATLSGGNFVQSAINTSNVTLSGGSGIITIGSLEYLDLKHLKIKLSSNGNDYDSDLTLTLSISNSAIKATTSTTTATIISTAEPNDLHKRLYGMTNETKVLGSSDAFWVNMEIGQSTWDATQIGYGKGTNPETYTWTNAVWYEDVASSINKRVHAQINIPATQDTGTFYIAGRARILSNSVWCYASDNDWSHSYNTINPTFYVKVTEIPKPQFIETKKVTKGLTINWTRNKDYKNVVVISKKNSEPTDLVGGTTYSLNDGDINGSGKIVYIGSDSVFTHNDLEDGTTYHYKVFANNNNYYSKIDNGSITSQTTKANQTITFDAIAAKKFGDADFTLSASTTSSLAITFGSKDASIIEISGTSAKIKKAGTVELWAIQAGNENYNLDTAKQTITISKASQEVTFDAITAKKFGDADFTLSASTTSSLPITFVSKDASIIEISGTSAKIKKAGSVELWAIQAGNENYNLDTTKQTISIAKADQTITFDQLTDKNVSDVSFTLSASASSGLNVSFESSNTNVAEISGNTVTIKTAGDIIITAKQAGNENYNAAEKQQSLKINAVATIISNATEKDGFKVFPTTTENEINVEFIASFEKIQINIYDVKGQLRKTKTIDSIEALETKTIDISDLNPGIYIVTANFNNKNHYCKIVKK